MGKGISIEPIRDRAWLAAYIEKRWGKPGVVSHGRLWVGDELVGLRASEDGETAGAVSWQGEEIVTLDSERPGRGVGTKLLDAALREMRGAGIRQARLITTNDNIDALRFHQRRGWRLAALYPNAVAESRKVKPSIPEIGAYGIPIRDEIELESVI